MHDIFISHSVKDQEISDCLYNYLEAKGIKCFMDRRNLLPGKPYPSQLAEAIRGSQLVILVFSSSSDISEPVQNEIGLARNNRIPIIPVRIENVLPQELALFITTSQWLDAFPPPIEKHLPKLVNAVKTHLETKQKTEEIVLDDLEHTERGESMEDLQAIEKLSKSVCPICGEPIKWGRAVNKSHDTEQPIQDYGAGYYRLPDIVPREEWLKRKVGYEKPATCSGSCEIYTE